MSNDEVIRLNALPVELLRQRARLPFPFLPDIPAVLADFANSLLHEIRTPNPV